MHLDMHFYGTYAMARAAGLNVKTCTTIATAAQFVDDNAKNDALTLKDGARVDILATAHHANDISNIELDDQRLVWVPFHFLPGNEGNSYTERLMCRKNSALAQEMVEHHLSMADRPFAAELLGVTAHVYADTFSHYGFSGVGSRRNRVDNGSIKLHGLGGAIDQYIRNKAKLFFSSYNDHGGLVENIRAFALDVVEKISGALGHGSVATYPDRPYLSWSFDYENEDMPSSDRDNLATFLEACEALHAMFSRFAAARPELTDQPPKPFADIKSMVSNVLATEANCDGRIEAWREAASSGDLFPGGAELLPTYSEDTWHQQRESFCDLEDSRTAIDLEAFRFYQASAIHRTYVLRDLMPKYMLVID